MQKLFEKTNNEYIVTFASTDMDMLAAIVRPNVASDIRADRNRNDQANKKRQLHDQNLTEQNLKK